MINKLAFYKIDNWQIGVAYLLVFLIPVSLGYIVYFKLDYLGLVFMQIMVSLFIANGLLVSGRLKRKKEHKISIIEELLQRSKNLTIHDIYLITTIPPSFIRHAIAIINKQRGVHYFLEESTGVVISPSDHSKRVATVLTICNGCGAKNEIIDDLVWEPVCKYCDSILTVEIKKTKLGLKSRFKRLITEKEFSAIFFLILLIIFWPAAIFYVLWVVNFFAAIKEIWNRDDDNYKQNRK